MEPLMDMKTSHASSVDSLPPTTGAADRPHNSKTAVDRAPQVEPNECALKKEQQNGGSLLSFFMPDFSLSKGLFLLSIVAFWLIVHTFLHYQADAKGCAMAYMRPQYVRMTNFGSEYTRFSEKYALFLYREGGMSHQHNYLEGIPVLFIPGNAGSYKQARSFASEAAYYQAEHSNEHSSSISLDFFTVDFNEDFTAFHGQTVLDQAEYVNEAIAFILSLYKNQHPKPDTSHPDPTSVILVGHSMGGMVARTLFTLSNYRDASVNSIFTLATPHSRAPASFDGDMVSIYRRVNQFWRHEYLQPLGQGSLQNVTVVSIAGGSLDNTVPSDYSVLDSILPRSHGLQVYTTSIPGVWTSMDHLAITWCDQLRKSVVKTIYGIIDPIRSTKTAAVSDRMAVFSNNFFPSVGVDPALPSLSGDNTFTLPSDGPSVRVLESGDFLISSSQHDTSSIRLIPIPQNSSQYFELLTTKSVDSPQKPIRESVVVLLCRVPTSSDEPGSVSSSSISTEATQSKAQLRCWSVHDHVARLPQSLDISDLPSNNVEASMAYVRYPQPTISSFDYVAVVDNSLYPGWVAGGFSASRDIVLSDSLFRIIFSGVKVDFSPDSRILTTIKIPAIQSSLLAYTLSFSSHPSSNEAHAVSKQQFAPLLQTFLSDINYSKFFVNLKMDQSVAVRLYGQSPYTPPRVFFPQASPLFGVNLWLDPASPWRDRSISISIKIDILGSLGQLWMRYRTLLVILPLSVVSLTLRRQLKMYSETGVFSPFSTAFDNVLTSSIPTLAFVLTAIHFLLGLVNIPVQAGSPWWELLSVQSNALLGTTEPIFGVLIPLFLLVSAGIAMMINYLFLGLIYILSFVVRPFLRLQSQTAQRSNEPDVNGDHGPSDSIHSISSTERFGLSSLFSWRRGLAVAVFIPLVPNILPYPFVFVLLCLIQVSTCVRALVSARSQDSGAQLNRFNYAYSVLMLMFWLLPCNLPVLVVWFRNLTVRWFAPFSTYHGMLSFLPYVSITEICRRGGMLPKSTTRSTFSLSSSLVVIALVTPLIAVDQTYLLHHMGAVVVALMILAHLWKVDGGAVSGLDESTGLIATTRPT